MTKPTVKIHDVATGEIVEREMTVKELADFNAANKLAEDEQLAYEAAKETATAKLAKLGLTTADLTALGINV